MIYHSYSSIFNLTDLTSAYSTQRNCFDYYLEKRNKKVKIGIDKSNRMLYYRQVGKSAAPHGAVSKWS